MPTVWLRTGLNFVCVCEEVQREIPTNRSEPTTKSPGKSGRGHLLTRVLRSRSSMQDREVEPSN